jgi:hypothetical protein
VALPKSETWFSRFRTSFDVYTGPENVVLSFSRAFLYEDYSSVFFLLWPYIVLTVPAVGADVFRYHNNNQPTGLNPDEIGLNTRSYESIHRSSREYRKGLGSAALQGNSDFLRSILLCLDRRRRPSLSLTITY